MADQPKGDRVIGQEHLRRLEQDLSRGVLSPDAYHAQRALLMSQLEVPAGQTPAWHRQPPVAPANGRRPPAPGTDWVTQGPEQPTPAWLAGKGRVVGSAVAAVVLVTAVLVSLFRGDAPASVAATTNGSAAAPPVVEQRPPGLPVMSEPPAPKPEPADNAAALADLPGQDPGSGRAFDMAALEAGKFLPDKMIARLKQAGMTDGLLRTSGAGPTTSSLITVRVPDQPSATAASWEYAYAEQEGGLLNTGDLSLHGVPVFTAPTQDGNGMTYRAVYVLYTRVVVVDVSGPKDSVLPVFRALLDAQVRKAPPTDRSLN